MIVNKKEFYFIGKTTQHRVISCVSCLLIIINVNYLSKNIKIKEHVATHACMTSVVSQLNVFLLIIH